MKKSAPSVEESHDAPKPQKPAQELNNVAVPMAAMQANTVDPRQSQAYNQAPPSPYAQPPVQQSYNQSPVQSSYNSSVQQSFVQQPVQQPFGQPPVQQSFMDNRQSVMSNQYPGSPDIAAIQSPVTYAATSSPSPVVAPAAPQAQYRVTVEFTPTQDDEVSMTLGDVVVVNEQFEDGWAYGRNLSNGREGFFPMSCFQLQQQPQGGWAERTLSLNRRQ
ncbi:hypothetical protein BKA69DRAFT_640657 [Paraphysoderma sedebokerense]|nr:hypothetical protein BKA69DRAFT_640657 [Paraphysoderma sedebokerense]